MLLLVYHYGIHCQTFMLNWRKFIFSSNCDYPPRCKGKDSCNDVINEYDDVMTCNDDVINEYTENMQQYIDEPHPPE